MAAGLGRITILWGFPPLRVIDSSADGTRFDVLREGDCDTALMQSPLPLASIGRSGFGVRGRARHTSSALRQEYAPLLEKAQEAGRVR
ncbi:hypothetical protein M3D48_02110 [Dermabacter vaginalis]|uniref:hypothetical protein n=1 Tax=Dermabacter vaginalis TaxID=1630135 RepID=UPI0021A7966E|nr:hypothetical protein [Dermabacter vaginalis]MCT2149427.1 hypothetical protein [Dermabacter vaginalis]